MKKKTSLMAVLLISISVSLILAQKVENFELNSVTNNEQFNLSEAKGKYVALHFLLKTECPVCLRFTHEYFEKMDKLSNVEQVFIKPDTEEEIKDWAEGLSKDELDKYTIYRDPNAKLAKKLNIPDGYEFHNQVVHYPALVLIDPKGKEVFRFVGKNNRDRYSFEQLESKVKELSN